MEIMLDKEDAEAAGYFLFNNHSKSILKPSYSRRGAGN
jgi:hypothetical protein